MACFSEQIKPIWTSPSSMAKTCGLQHGGIGDADKLELLIINIVAGNDKKPGSVRRAVNMVLLNRAVDFLFFRRQPVEIMLGGGRHGFDNILQRIAEIPVPQIEKLHRDLGIGQELRWILYCFRYSVME